MRKFLLASLLLFGVATNVSMAFAAGDLMADDRFYRGGGSGAMTRYADLLRTSVGFLDTTYIGYTPGQKTAGNYWSVRASTPDVGTVHRPPAAGCMWTFDPAGEATANGYINGDSLQGWWLVHGNYRQLGFRPSQGDLVIASANSDQGNVSSMWPQQGRNFGIIGVWHADRGNAAPLSPVAWAPITGANSAWCGLRTHNDNSYIDPITLNSINADVQGYNIGVGAAPAWHNFPGYCDQWDQLLYKDIDGIGHTGNLTVSFKYIATMSTTSDATVRVGWFDKDPLGRVSTAGGVPCNTNPLIGGVNYVSGASLAGVQPVDSFMVYVGAPVGNTDFLPYNTPYYVVGDPCARATAREPIYDTLRRWFGEVLEVSTRPRPLYKELLSVADSTVAPFASSSFTIPADSLAPWLTAGSGKVRLVFRVKTNGTVSDEAANFDSHTKGAAIVDDVTYGWSDAGSGPNPGPQNSPANWGTFELANAVDNTKGALTAWKSTAKPPFRAQHLEVLGSSGVENDDLCGTDPHQVGRTCSMVDNVITFGLHQFGETVGNITPSTVDHDYRCDSWCPTIQLRGPYNQTSPGHGVSPVYNNMGIRAPGGPGDADAGSTGEYWVDYEIFARTGTSTSCGPKDGVAYGWLAQCYPNTDLRNNVEWGAPVISVGNIQCDPICFRSIPGLTGQEGGIFSTSMMVWDDNISENANYPDSIRIGFWMRGQSYRPGVVTPNPTGGMYLDNISLTIIDAGGSPLSALIWDFWNDSFPFDDDVTPGYNAEFDTTSIKIRTGVNNANANAHQRYSTPADSMLVTATGQPPQRVDLIFRILPGPGNYVQLGNAATGVAKVPTGGTPTAVPPNGRTQISGAAANSKNFWESYKSKPGPFASSQTQHQPLTPGFWDPNAWNSARCDTAGRPVWPIQARGIGQPADPAQFFASTYHESEMGIPPSDPNLSTVDTYATLDIRSGLGLARHRCWLTAANAGQNDIDCVGSHTLYPYIPAVLQAWQNPPAGDAHAGDADYTYEFTKIIPDGVLAPGAHVEYFYRLAENGALTFAGMMPDTSIVFPQLPERNNDSHRWQEFSALPDRWKTANYVHPVLGQITGGPACLLVVDSQDANTGDEGPWVGVADTIGATKQEKWGAHNGWHAKGGGLNINIPANNLTNDGVTSGFIARHGGHPGTTWDMFQIKAAESGAPAISFAQRYSYDDGVGVNPQLYNREAYCGPSDKQLQFFYKSILWLTGGLSGNLLGPYQERTSKDTDFIKRWITSGSNATPERWWISMGSGFVENNALATSVSPGALHPNLLMQDYFGCTMVNAGYRNVGSHNSLINLSPKRGGLLYDAFSPNKAWSIANFCTHTNDVIGISATLAADGTSEAAWYHTDSTYAAVVYKPWTAAHPWIALTNGFVISELYNNGGEDTKGRSAYFLEILTKLFAGQNACKPAGTPIVGLDVPSLDDGNVLADFVNLRNNPLQSGFARIHFGLSRDDQVEIKVFDVGGRLIRTLADRGFKAGEHDLVWDGTDNGGRPVSRGVYFTQVRYRNSAFSDAKKLTVLK